MDDIWPPAQLFDRAEHCHGEKGESLKIVFIVFPILLIDPLPVKIFIVRDEIDRDIAVG